MPSGNYRVEAPPGEHDDEVFALALALTACVEPPTLSPQRRLSRNRRYAPTQEQAESGNWNSKGSAIMRDMRRKRTEERWERSGLVI